MKSGRLLENLAAADVSHAQLERIYLDHMHAQLGSTRAVPHDRRDRRARSSRYCGATAACSRCSALIGALMLVALLTAWATHAKQEQQVRRAQAHDQEAFLRQGNKPSHSAAHFGRMAYKPPAALAVFDPGAVALSRPGDLARSAPAGSRDVPSRGGRAGAQPAGRSQRRGRSDQRCCRCSFSSWVTAPSRASASAERCARS